MTKAKIEPARILANFLRNQITDINSSRSTSFIYPDFPRINDIGNTDFPRVGITILSESSEPQGIFDDNQRETINFQIDVVSKKGIGHTVTVTDEFSGTLSSTVNSNRFTFVDLPGTVENIKHDGTAYTNVTQVTTNGNFTTPASMQSGTVEFAYSTGDMNFSSTDVSAHDGQEITTTYSYYLEGKRQAQYLARKIVKAIRNNWRTDTTLNGLFNPVKISNNPQPLDEELGIYRQTIEYQFNQFNSGEGL